MTKRFTSGDLHSASSVPEAEITDEPSTATVHEWRKELEISAAQLAAGRVVESSEVLRDVEEAVARIKAKKAAAPQR